MADKFVFALLVTRISSAFVIQLHISIISFCDSENLTKRIATGNSLGGRDIAIIQFKIPAIRTSIVYQGILMNRFVQYSTKMFAHQFV